MKIHSLYTVWINRPEISEEGRSTGNLRTIIAYMLYVKQFA